MHEPTHRTTIAFIQALRELLREQLPHLAGDVLEIEVHSLTRRERAFSVFVPRPTAPPAPSDHTPPPATRAGPQYNEIEQDILDALGEAGGEELTGQQIADRAGYPFDAGIRRALASLRRRGVLTGQPGEQGYKLASPGGPPV